MYYCIYVLQSWWSSDLNHIILYQIGTSWGLKFKTKSPKSFVDALDIDHMLTDEKKNGYPLLSTDFRKRWVANKMQIDDKYT